MSTLKTRDRGLAGPHSNRQLALAQAGLNPGFDEFSGEAELGTECFEFFPEAGVFLPLEA